MEKEEIMASVGKNMRKLRKDANLTQEYMAEKAGISVSHYAAIENGRKSMSIPVLMAIGNTLGVNCDRILKEPNPEVILEDINQLLRGKTVGYVSFIEKTIRLYNDGFIEAGGKDA